MFNVESYENVIYLRSSQFLILLFELGKLSACQIDSNSDERMIIKKTGNITSAIDDILDFVFDFKEDLLNGELTFLFAIFTEELMKQDVEERNLTEKIFRTKFGNKNINDIEQLIYYYEKYHVLKKGIEKLLKWCEEWETIINNINENFPVDILRNIQIHQLKNFTKFDFMSLENFRQLINCKCYSKFYINVVELIKVIIEDKFHLI